MRRLIAALPLALLLAACSPSPTPPPSATTQSAPDNTKLGSPAWYAWVDASLHISDGQGHGPDYGSAEWNQAVQFKLGEEAPQSKPGSPQWQQSVDALLRIRVPPAS